MRKRTVLLRLQRHSLTPVTHACYAHPRARCGNALLATLHLNLLSLPPADSFLPISPGISWPGHHSCTEKFTYSYQRTSVTQPPILPQTAIQNKSAPEATGKGRPAKVSELWRSRSHIFHSVEADVLDVGSRWGQQPRRRRHREDAGRPCVDRTVISSTGTAGTSRSRPPADARLVIGTGALRLGSQVRGQQVTQMRAGGAATRRRVPAHLCLRFMYLYSHIQKQLAQDPPSQRPGLDKCPGTRGPLETVSTHCAWALSLRGAVHRGVGGP